MEHLGCRIHHAGWEFGIRNTIPAIECRKGQISRPFLPEYFPDHELFFWIDADAWVQDPSAIDLFLNAAISRGWGIVPELERSSKFMNGGLEFYLECMKNLYGQVYGSLPEAQNFHFVNMNAGVFCGHRDSHVWSLWKTSLHSAIDHFLARSPSTEQMTAVFGLIDQIALNVGLRSGGLETAIDLLPFSCNWACHLALPAFDERRKQFVEPYSPHAPIGILHLTNPWGGEVAALPHAHERRSRRVPPMANGKQFYKQCRLETTEGGNVVASLFRSDRTEANSIARCAFPADATRRTTSHRRAPVQAYDYVSPGLVTIWPDKAFPHMIEGNPADCQWPFLRRTSPHRWYVDRRFPTIGFVSRDESAILYSSALPFKGMRGLEIGCWQGWSACHIASAGLQLDVIDPILAHTSFRPTIEQSLKKAGVWETVSLYALSSPSAVRGVANAIGEKWPFFFIDGDPEGDAVLNDTLACMEHAAQDCVFLFHDLISPDVAKGLVRLQDDGWNTMVYLTSQIMGVAWRGSVQPVRHTPDAAIAELPLPAHLERFDVSRG
ncbi:MAG: class I SAM-dependent methyltransferase [Planctomycetia bacterium]|nr:class I SAM-dependent methyltransferase [Planctomycetia bacterium]